MIVTQLRLPEPAPCFYVAGWAVRRCPLSYGARVGGWRAERGGLQRGAATPRI